MRLLPHQESVFYVLSYTAQLMSVWATTTTQQLQPQTAKRNRVTLRCPRLGPALFMLIFLDSN